MLILLEKLPGGVKTMGTIMNVKEVGEFLKLSESTVYKLVNIFD